MVSGKERLRLERVFSELEQRNMRQKVAIDRLSAAMMEASAALFEIAEGNLEPGSLRVRAREALERISEMTQPKEDGGPTPSEEMEDGSADG